MSNTPDVMLGSPFNLGSGIFSVYPCLIKDFLI